MKITDAAAATGSHDASPEDFSLGESLAVYGVTYLITDADGFTRDWLRDNHGRELGAPVATPEDPAATLKASRSRNKARLGPPSPRTDDLARFNEARLGKPSNVLDSDSLRQFLVCYFRWMWASIVVFGLKPLHWTHLGNSVLAEATLHATDRVWMPSRGHDQPFLAWLHYRLATSLPGLHT